MMGVARCHRHLVLLVLAYCSLIIAYVMFVSTDSAHAWDHVSRGTDNVDDEPSNSGMHPQYQATTNSVRQHQTTTDAVRYPTTTDTVRYRITTDSVQHRPTNDSAQSQIATDTVHRATTDAVHPPLVLCHKELGLQPHQF